MFSTAGSLVKKKCDLSQLQDSYTVSPSHLEHVATLESVYSGPDYQIDWGEVKQGKAAGMPGQWTQNVMFILLHSELTATNPPTHIHLPHTH